MEIKNILFTIIFFIISQKCIEFCTGQGATTPAPSVCTESLKKKFEEWKAEFNIVYSTPQEENMRREIFCANSRKVRNHNSNENCTYERKENAHSDKTTKERDDNLLGAEKKQNEEKVSSSNKVSYYNGRNVRQPFTTRKKTTMSTKTHDSKAAVTTVRTSTQRRTTRSTRRPSTTSTTMIRTTTSRRPTTTRSTTTRSTTTRPTTSTRPPSTRRTSTSRALSTTTTPKPPDMLSHPMNNGPIPNSVNYTMDCTTVKDQYGCGSCWIFAATGIVEYWRKKVNKYSNVSEQNILDCNAYGDDCNGGWPLHAMYHMMKSGVADGALYTYKSRQENCSAKEYPPIVKMSNACEVELRGNETLLKELVARRGPISVVIHVVSPMYSYSSGIFNEPNRCSNTTYNHAVVVVGYGSFNNGSNPADYWIIRNSWGTSWGMNGYGLMARNRNNQCAIATYANFPC